MKTVNVNNRYDVIVIGSGIGGMTAASILSQFYNKRVLIIERHFTFGGLTHEFKRNGATFSPGFHYIGGMEEKSATRKVFDVVTGFQVEMKKMPDTYDKFIYPSGAFVASANKDNFIASLKEKFPAEATAIDLYFKDIFTYNKLFSLYVARNAVPNPIKQFVRLGQAAYAFFLPKRISSRSTLQQYLDSQFKDPTLKALLASQWGDYGVLPSEAAMLMHSVIATHYIDGSWFPANGTTQIGNAVRDIIEKSGGKIVLANAAEKVICDKNKAISVKLSKPDKEGIQEFFASHIISNVGADRTYNYLLPNSGKVFPAIQKNIRPLISKENMVSAFITLRISPEKFGCNGGNMWWYKYENHEKNICSVVEVDFPRALYISFRSLKVNQPEKHTLDVMTTVPHSDFERWKNEKWMKRGEEYLRLKQEIASKIMGRLDELMPGVKDAVESIEIATPLTTENFTGRTTGSSYGLAATPERFHQNWLSVFTPVKNFYLCGQDISSAGIVGAMMGGVCSAGAVVGGTGFIKVMGRIMKEWGARQ